VVAALAGHVCARQPAQFPFDKRGQLLERAIIAGTPRTQ
jgi:hypothetical protein